MSRPKGTPGELRLKFWVRIGCWRMAQTGYSCPLLSAASRYHQGFTLA